MGLNNDLLINDLKDLDSLYVLNADLISENQDESYNCDIGFSSIDNFYEKLKKHNLDYQCIYSFNNCEYFNSIIKIECALDFIESHGVKGFDEIIRMFNKHSKKFSSSSFDIVNFMEDCNNHRSSFSKIKATLKKSLDADAAEKNKKSIALVELDRFL
jgi:hypothetical protein